MIEFSDVTKEYGKGDVRALDSVSLEVEEKDFVFLVGPSGAGKSTLFKLLLREEKPSAGEIYFQELDIIKLPGRKIPQLRQRIGMVFQDFKLLSQRTVFENVSFALEVVGKTKDEIYEVVPYLLEQVGLDKRKDAFPHELSTGEQQRVAIARALAPEPEVLLADEPTGNLDKKNASQIVDLLRQVNEWGTTVIMATHDEDIVKKNNGRIVTIEDGILTEGKSRKGSKKK